MSTSSTLHRLVGVGLALTSCGFESESWHASVLRGWANDPVCSAERLAGPDGAKCGAATALVTLAEDESEEPIVEILTIGGGGSAGAAPFEKDALVEVASISKVFTAVLLQQLVDSGHLSLETRIGELFACPEPYTHPEVANITLLELASHTSGLPSQPDNRRVRSDNPFEGYSQADLCQSLVRVKGLPTRGRFYYSNFAFGLLGYLMELRMGLPFEDLVIRRVFEPLGMHDTKVTLTEDEWQRRVPPGLDPLSGEGPVWRRSSYGVLRGNGAFHSTLSEMARFLAAVIRAERGDERGPLSGTLRRALKQVTWDCPCVRGFCEERECREPTPERSVAALGWQSFSHGSLRGWHKAGDTEGYSSFIAFLSKAGRGAFGFDTCGGCGLRETKGSAIQRTVQHLARGPWPATSF